MDGKRLLKIQNVLKLKAEQQPRLYLDEICNAMISKHKEVLLNTKTKIYQLQQL